MADYKIVLKESIRKDFKSIPVRDGRKIFSQIDLLAAEPRRTGVEKVSGRELYRIRRGDYRIIFSINDEEHIVTVEKVAHRKDVYRDF